MPNTTTYSASNASAIRILPHDDHAERSLIGAMLIDSRAADICVASISAEDFYDKRNKIICQAIYALASDGKPTDIVTVADLLRNHGELGNAGGIDYISGITLSTLTPETARHHANIVSQCSMRRRVISASMAIANMAYEPGELHSQPGMLEEAAMRELLTASDRVSTNYSIDPFYIVNSAIEKYSAEKYSESAVVVTTGISGLDKILREVNAGDLMVIAAMTSQGKSTLALQMAMHMARHGIGCYYASMEMTSYSMVRRMAATDSRTPIGAAMTRPNQINEDVYNTVMHIFGEYSTLPIYFDERSRTLPQIKSRCRELRGAGKLGAIFVDHLQLLRMPQGQRVENRRTEIGNYANELKSIAMDFGVPVFLVSQLNRVPGRESREPQLYDLKESGDVENAADQVVFIHHTGNDSDGDGGDSGSGNRASREKPIEDAMLIVAKNRNGGLGHVEVSHDKQRFLFKEIYQA